MASLFISKTEIYRVDTESEVRDFIEKAKEEANGEGYFLKSHSADYKEKKQKGEVIDSCYVVKLNKIYDSIWGN